MKKIILSFFIACLAFTTVNAQEAVEATDQGFSKWQMRFRLITAIPSVDDDIDGADVDVSTAFAPEIDFTYFFTENWAAELILGTTKHNVEIEDIDVDLGHVWLLPPTLNFQYHFTGGELKPYLGVGVNYTFFYGIDEGDVNDLEYDNSFGFSFQGGLDYNLNDKWFLNLDLKKILLKTDVTVDNSSDSVEVTIDPLVIGLGAGFKF